MVAIVADRRIRPATEADRGALFEICLRTAENGEDASGLYSDPRLPGYLWAAPYLKFAPEIRFHIDERFDEAERIERLLRTPAVQRDLDHKPDNEN